MKKNRIIETGYDFEVLYNWDCLQRIARRQEYRNLCKYLEFDSDGFAVKDLFGKDTSALDLKWKEFKALAGERYDELRKGDPSQADKYLKNFPQHEEEYLQTLFGEVESKTALQEKLLDHAGTRFGLITPIHPQIILSNKFSPSFFLKVPIFGRNPFAVTLLQARHGEDEDGNIVLNPIHEGHFLITKIDVAAHYKNQIDSGVKELLDKYRELASGEVSASRPCELISENEMSMTFRVDLVADEKDILSELHKIIAPNKNRYRLEKRGICYQIWDERKQRVSFPKIALKLGIKENTAKKGYYRAYELIIGKKHNKKSLRRTKLKRSELKKTCGTCPDRDQCKVLCPDALLFIEQDNVKQREGMQANYHILYSEDEDAVSQ